MSVKLFKAAFLVLFVVFAKTAIAAPDLTVGNASGDLGDTVPVSLGFTNGSGTTEASSMLVTIRMILRY